MLAHTHTMHTHTDKTHAHTHCSSRTAQTGCVARVRAAPPLLESLPTQDPLTPTTSRAPSPFPAQVGTGSWDPNPAATGGQLWGFWCGWWG